MRHISIKHLAGHDRHLRVRHGGLSDRFLYNEHILRIFAVFLWAAAIAAFIVLSR